MSRSRLSKTSALVARTPSQVALDVEKARQLLASSKTIEQAKSIRDRGKAVEALLVAQRAGADAVNEAIEVQLWAARRAGELLAELPKASGELKRGASRGARREPRAPTLEEQGLSKKESSRFQKLAAVPEREFTEHINGIRARGEKLTATGVITAASAQAGYDGDESYTPIEIIEDARYVLGGIDLDPFSCPVAQKRIGARIHYTKTQNGLLKPWKGRTWFQPPYTLEIIEQAVAKLLLALAQTDASHDVDDCIALTNQSEAAWWHKLARRSTAIVNTEGRINFDQPDGKGGTRPTKNNRFAQTFFYFGSRLDRFEERFEKHGTVFTPRPRRIVEAT